MSDREKLIELLRTIPQVNHAQAAVDGLDYVFGCAADHLIANGVTAQEWISVNDRLPETTCTNLVSCGEVMFLAYYDGKQWRSSGTLRVVPVKHWMPLPEPPKGE